MKVRSDSFVAGQPLPDALAFARPDPTSRVTLSDNRNPHLAWEDVPEGTRSFAVLCIDHDAPSRPDDVNHPDREVPILPRAGQYIHFSPITEEEYWKIEAEIAAGTYRLNIRKREEVKA